jgi:predicted nucleic acid-binding Zn ribbon protein
MSFQSLDEILTAIENQPGWDLQQQYRRLLQAWHKIVEPAIAEHARPLQITRRVLWVATSSSVWAQHLSLQRYPLLQKLKLELDQPLVDIRFSSVPWYTQKGLAGSSPDLPLVNCQRHPSSIDTEEEFSPLTELPPSHTPPSALQRWLTVLQSRSQSLPLCPQCQSPTPPGELERWTICAYCIARQWSF